MFYGFAVGVYKSAGMLRTHTFELFPENFNVFGSPAFIMAGCAANADVVVYGFGELLVPVAEIAKMKVIKDFKHPVIIFNPHMPKVIPVIGEFPPGGHIWRQLVFVQVSREF